MRVSILSCLIISCIWAENAEAQGTKDPSSPVSTMVFPIRPRDEPATTRPVVVPSTKLNRQIRLRPIQQGGRRVAR